MPHLIIEYSANIADQHDVDALVGAVHQAALDHGLAALDALRTRAVERRHYRVADGGADLGFIAITARIGPGRDPADKASFLEHLLDTAQRQVEGEGSEPAIAWSIELQEIDPEFRINRNGVRQRLAERAAPAPPQPTT